MKLKIFDLFYFKLHILELVKQKITISNKVHLQLENFRDF